MLQLIAPDVSNVEKHIRSLGVSSFPTGDTFWYEDIPQIPARLATQYFIVNTSEPGKQHQLFLNGREYKTFIPDSEVYSLPLVLQQGIYDYELKTDTTTVSGAFQISLKELIFWTWVQRMIPTFNTLEIQESLINTLGNEFLFELIYPNDILNLSKTPYSLKSFISSGNENSPSRGLLGFASALMNKPIRGVESTSDLADSQDDYSHITLPLPYETISRKKSFSTQHKPDEFELITSDMVKIKEVDRRKFEAIPIDFSSKLIVNSYVPNEDYRPSDFRFRLITTDFEDFDVLEFPEITSFTSSVSYVNYGDFVELTPVFLNGTGKINDVSVESGSTYKFYPVDQTDYILSVTNSVGSPVTQTLTIGVGSGPVINYFELGVSTLEYGGSTVLTSIFGGLDTIGTLDEGSTYITSGDFVTVSPTSTTTYTLTVTDGVTTLDRSITLTILPQQTSFSPDRLRILKGSSTLLTANFVGNVGNVPGVGNVKSGIPFKISPAITTTYNLVVDDVTVASSFIEVVDDNNSVPYKGLLTENVQVQSSFVGVDSPNFAEWSLYGALDETVTDISQDNQGVVSCTGHGLNTGQKIVFKNSSASFRIQAIVRASTTTVTAEGHDYIIGDKVKIKNVVGMSEINDQVLEILSVSGDDFVLDIDSLTYGLYLSGGSVSLGMDELNDTVYRVAYVSEDELSFSETEPVEIINITQASPAKVTTLDDHGLINGDKIILYNVKGMKALNGDIVTVTYVDETSFTIGVNTTDTDVYATFTGTAQALKLVDTSNFTNFRQGTLSLFITTGFGSRQVNVDDFIEGDLNDVILLNEPLNLAVSLDDVYDVEYTEGYTGNGYNGKLHIQTSVNPYGTFVNNFYVENPGNKYKTGEYLSIPVPSYMTISSITKANPGVVTCSSTHQLKTGDRVKFINLSGMTQLNNNTYTITRISSTQFSLGVNTSGYGTYISGSGELQVFIDMVISSVVQKPEDLDLTFYASEAVLMNDDSSTPVTLSFYQKPVLILQKVKNIHQFENKSVEYSNLTLVGEFLITNENVLLNRSLNKLAPIEPVKLNVSNGEHKVLDFYWKIAPTVIDVISKDPINWNLYANAIDAEVEAVEELESTVVTITVETARLPIIIDQPDSVITKDGDDVTASPLSIEIENTDTKLSPVSSSKVFYQWYKDGAKVGSEIEETVGVSTWDTSTYDYGVSGIASSTNNGSYYCVVTNTLNGTSLSTTSNQVSVFSVNRPTVTSITDQETFVDGGFGVKQSATGNANLTYQWQKGTPKTITGITRANPAVVTCTAHEFSTSDVVTFGTIVGMTALSGLSGTVTYIGANSFSVNIDTSNISVFGSFVSGQVMKPTNVSNTTATTDRLFISTVISGDAGSYLCKVTNTKSSYSLSKSSNFFTLTTATALGPIFTLQPQSATFSTVGTYKFNSLAENLSPGDGTIKYQWYKNDSLIPNATKKDLTISVSTLGINFNGNYYCEATNDNGSTNSQTATFTYIQIISPQPLIYESFPLATVSPLTISPAVNSKTTWDLTTDGNLVLSPAGTWTVTPTGGNCRVKAKLWGAAGGAGGLDTITNSTYNDQNFDTAFGGGGGYIEGYINLLSTTAYTLTVGGGGKKGANNAAGSGGGAGGYNGGGAGGHAGPSNKSGSGGGGAGRTEILYGSIRFAASGGGAGAGGEGMYDSSGTYRSPSSAADKTLNDGNRSLGYQTGVREGGSALPKSGDGGGNGGGGSGWEGGNANSSYTSGDANGYGGGAGSTNYNITYFTPAAGSIFNPPTSSTNSAGRNYSGWNLTAGLGGASDGGEGLIILESAATLRYGISLTVLEGNQAVFVVNEGVSESGTSYQWYSGAQSSGTLIPGATSPIYTIASTSLSNSGNYYCLITKELSVKSKFISLFICSTPKIVTQPASSSVASNSTVTLSVAANANGILTYQWYQDNSPISNATSASLVLSSVSTSASYYCVVTNTVNDISASKQSNSALITVTSSGGGGKLPGTVYGRVIYFALQDYPDGNFPTGYSVQDIGGSVWVYNGTTFVQIS